MMIVVVVVVVSIRTRVMMMMMMSIQGCRMMSYQLFCSLLVFSACHRSYSNILIFIITPKVDNAYELSLFRDG